MASAWAINTFLVMAGFGLMSVCVAFAVMIARED